MNYSPGLPQGIVLLMLIMHLIHAIGFQPRLSVIPGGCGYQSHFICGPRSHLNFSENHLLAFPFVWDAILLLHAHACMQWPAFLLVPPDAFLTGTFITLALPFHPTSFPYFLGQPNPDSVACVL